MLQIVFAAGHFSRNFAHQKILFFIILFGGAVGGFVILFLRDLQCRLLKKRGIRYDFSTDITITLRKKVREYREKLAK